jgi:hypothetical protein
MELIMEFREYNDIEKYRDFLVGKKIKSVDFFEDADEGLIITLDNETSFYFGFSRCEGEFYFKQRMEIEK